MLHSECPGGSLPRIASGSGPSFTLRTPYVTTVYNPIPYFSFPSEGRAEGAEALPVAVGQGRTVNVQEDSGHRARRPSQEDTARSDRGSPQEGAARGGSKDDRSDCIASRLRLAEQAAGIVTEVEADPETGEDGLGGLGGVFGQLLIRPTGLSEAEIKEYDTLVARLPRTWQTHLSTSLEFTPVASQYRLKIKTKEKLIDYLEVFNQEQLAIRQLLMGNIKDPDSPEQIAEWKSAYDMNYSNKDRLVTSAFAPHERVSGPQIVHWTLNGGDLQDRVNRALAKLWDDAGDVPLQSEIIITGQHLIIAFDSLHLALAGRSDAVESLVRRLTFLFSVAEDYKREKCPQAWEGTDLFLGTFGGSRAMAYKLLRKSKADAKKSSREVAAQPGVCVFVLCVALITKWYLDSVACLPQ